jgi:hypothetical protein
MLSDILDTPKKIIAAFLGILAFLGVMWTVGILFVPAAKGGTFWTVVSDGIVFTFGQLGVLLKAVFTGLAKFIQNI